MRLLLSISSLASLTAVAALALACGNSTTSTDNHPAAGDDDDDDDASTTHDASSGDDDASPTGDAATGTTDGAADDASTGPTVDGGEEISCSGTASCATGDACIADYATAQTASNWCRFAGVAKTVTEYGAVCSGYHVVKITTGVVGALTFEYYDVASGALVATLHQSLETQKSCTGSPAQVSSDPCGDNAGTTTVLADGC